MRVIYPLFERWIKRLFAYLIASQIDAGGCYSGDGVSQIDEIALSAGVDMAVKWQPSVAFFECVSKPALLKILSEQCGESAADNCAGMKKADLALAMADRLAGKNWLPPVLVTKHSPISYDSEEAA